jgi:hypothetical protein
MLDLGLYDSEEDVPPRSKRCVSRQLGGIKVYASTQATLDRGTQKLGELIVDTCSASLALTPSLIRYLVQNRVDGQVPRRCFSAVLGWQMRSGLLDSVLCEGQMGSAFRVIVHAPVRSRFEERTKESRDLLRDARRVQISVLRDKYYAESTKGSWTQASFIAARVVRLGWARYVDRFTIEMPGYVSDAIRHSV